MVEKVKTDVSESRSSAGKPLPLETQWAKYRRDQKACSYCQNKRDEYGTVRLVRCPPHEQQHSALVARG